MWNNFCRVFGTCKLLYESFVSKQSVFTPLYRGVKDTLEIASTSKKSHLKLDQITNDLMPDLVIVLWRSNFKSIPSLEEHWCMHSCCSCPVADIKQSSGDSGCTRRTIVLFQRSPKNKHPMPSSPFECVAIFFQSSAMIGVIKSSFEQHLKFSSLPLCNDLQMLLTMSASGDQLLRRVLLMTSASSGPLVFRTSFLQMLQASFLLIPLLSFVLSEPML